MKNLSADKHLAILRKMTDDYNRENPEWAALSVGDRIKSLGVRVRKMASELDNARMQRLEQRVAALEYAFEQLPPEAQRLVGERVREAMAREAVFEDWRREQARSGATS